MSSRNPTLQNTRRNQSKDKSIDEGGAGEQEAIWAGERKLPCRLGSVIGLALRGGSDLEPCRVRVSNHFGFLTKSSPPTTHLCSDCDWGGGRRLLQVEPNRFQVCLLNHSDISTLTLRRSTAQPGPAQTLSLCLSFLLSFSHASPISLLPSPRSRPKPAQLALALLLTARPGPPVSRFPLSRTRPALAPSPADRVAPPVRSVSFLQPRTEPSRTGLPRHIAPPPSLRFNSNHCQSSAFTLSFTPSAATALNRRNGHHDRHSFTFKAIKAVMAPARHGNRLGRPIKPQTHPELSPHLVSHSLVPTPPLWKLAIAIVAAGRSSPCFSVVVSFLPFVPPSVFYFHRDIVSRRRSPRPPPLVAGIPNSNLAVESRPPPLVAGSRCRGSCTPNLTSGLLVQKPLKTAHSSLGRNLVVARHPPPLVAGHPRRSKWFSNPTFRFAVALARLRTSNRAIWCSLAPDQLNTGEALPQRCRQPRCRRPLLSPFRLQPSDRDPTVQVNPESSQRGRRRSAKPNPQSELLVLRVEPYV
nr:unnamed protein product [Digitaria exilis]